MRRVARVDTNQSEIVQALRQCGASVMLLHAVGQGCPDLLIGVAGTNILAEVKDGRRPPSERKLTKDEAFWHQMWRGQVCILTSVDEAVALVQAVRHGH